ncbi:hypothetical protein HDU97_010052, partial [Phlyctochytrium planicorne]
EYYDGQKVQLYNDLFVYNIDKNEWRKITSPNTPGPRSSHQLILSPAGRGYLFGGEFVSPNQTTFFHYKDFWSLDLTTYAWEKMDVGKKPSPRSGHRQLLWKHLIFLFGGFYDSGNEVRYLNDLHVFDTIECKWTELTVAEPKPTKRSGFQLVLHNDTMVLYGGYVKEVVKGQRDRGVVHNDTWHMKLSTQLETLRWERQRKGGFTPDPRSGSPMVYCKTRAFMFGGVVDVKEDEEKIESVCTDEMFQLNIDQNRFYPTTFQRKKGPAHANDPLPTPRFNSMLCTVKSKIYMFGGVLEKGSKELTYADFWSFDMDKGRCEVECLTKDELAGKSWLGAESDSESEDEDDDEDDDDEEDEEDEDEDDEDGDDDDDDDRRSRAKRKRQKEKEKEQEKNERKAKKEQKEQQEKAEALEISKLSLHEPKDFTLELQPRPVDISLKAYFERTSPLWVYQIRNEADSVGVSIKAQRRDAFERARKTYAEALPELVKEWERMEEDEAKAEEVKRKAEENSSRGRRL